MKPDITKIEDIKLLVNEFYAKIRQDELLGEVFNNKIQDLWPEHLEKMVRFWQTVLLGQHTYYGSPFPPHAQLPVSAKHFSKWLLLFNETIIENFEGETANKAIFQGERMAEMFESKISYFNNNGQMPLINNR